MSGWRVATIRGSFLRENAQVFDEKNRAFTICAYACQTEASYEDGCGWQISEDLGMLALIYFALAACVGDFFCRRFYQFESVAHRCAAAILVGLLVSSWFTYLAGLAFFWTSRPLLWANLLFFVAAVALLSWPKWKGRIVKRTSGEAYPKRSNLYLPRPRGSSIADWLLIAGYVVLVSWMMFASFNSKAGKLQIANPEVQRFRAEYRADAELCRRTQFPHGIPAFLRRPDPLPLLVLFSGGKSGIPRTRSSVEPEST